MNIEDILNEYKFETLNSKHLLSDFCCDSNDLNDFLKNDALNQQHDKMNLTKLVVYNGDIIGYFSLLTDTLRLKYIRNDLTKKQLHSHLPKSKLLPTVKIGRFAIDNEYSGNGIGTHVLSNLIRNLIILSNNGVGFRFVVVDGFAKAFNFYTNKGNFVNLQKDDDEIMKLDKIIKKDPERLFYLYCDILKC